MKTSILFVFLFVGATSLSQELVIESRTAKEDTNVVYQFVDEPAEFPGGMKAMKKYLKNKLVRPESVVNGKIAGFCFLQFTVERDGSSTNLRIVRGVTDCPECDEEALRVIQNMPKWKPAKTNGEIVRYLYNLPIAFKPD
jgi:periplasmic protein TonB